LPYALWVDQHFTVYLGPEIAYAHAGETDPGAQTSTGGTAPDVTHSGHRLSIGGRAGAEIQFGFLGMPHLALDATIALTIDSTAGSSDGVATNGIGGPGTTTQSFDHLSLQTSTGHQPWNIFISNVAAVYYF
jgi:hypothetical protein